MIRSFSRGVVALLALLLCACPPSPAGSDAGPASDAGPGSDAGRGADAGRDAGSGSPVPAASLQCAWPTGAFVGQGPLPDAL